MGWVGGGVGGWGGVGGGWQEHDTLLSVAAMARTTVQTLLGYNRDVDPAAPLAVGQQLCLLLCSPPPPTADASR